MKLNLSSSEAATFLLLLNKRGIKKAIEKGSNFFFGKSKEEALMEFFDSRPLLKNVFMNSKYAGDITTFIEKFQ